MEVGAIRSWLTFAILRPRARALDQLASSSSASGCAAREIARFARLLERVAKSNARRFEPLVEEALSRRRRRRAR
jgi:hypothetical protein